MKKESNTINKPLSNFFNVPPELKKYINTLIGSLGLIALIWGAGASYSNISNEINNNKKDIDEIKIEFKTLKSDILELNELNNSSLNSKLIIYLTYKNKDQVKYLLEMEDYKYNYKSKKIFNDN